MPDYSKMTKDELLKLREQLLSEVEPTPASPTSESGFGESVLNFLSSLPQKAKEVGADVYNTLPNASIGSFPVNTRLMSPGSVSVNSGLVRGASLGLVDPLEMLGGVDDPTIQQIAQEAQGRVSGDVAEFAGSLLPFTGATKLARAIPGVANLGRGGGALRTILGKATQGGIGGGILGTGEETVSALKGDGFDVGNIVEEAALFAGFEGLFSIFPIIKQLRLQGKYNKAEQLYKEATKDIPGAMTQDEALSAYERIVGDIDRPPISRGGSRTDYTKLNPPVDRLNTPGSISTESKAIAEELLKIRGEQLSQTAAMNAATGRTPINPSLRVGGVNTFKEKDFGIFKSKKTVNRVTTNKSTIYNDRDFYVSQKAPDIEPISTTIKKPKQQGISTAGVKSDVVNNPKPKLVKPKTMEGVTLTSGGLNPDILKKTTDDIITGSKYVGAKVKTISDFVGVTDKNLSPLGEKARDAVIQRRANIQKAQEDLNLYTKDIKKKITDKENETLKFYIQKTGNPRTGETFEQVSKSLSPEAKGAATTISNKLEAVRQRYNEIVKTDDIGRIENYVTQLYDGTEEQINRAINHFRVNSPFAKKRTVESYYEAIDKFGLKPKYEKITDIVDAYTIANEKTIQNNVLVQELQKIELPTEQIKNRLGVVFSGAKNQTTKKIISTEYVDGYVAVKSSGLYSATGGKGLGQTVYVHPDIKEPIKTVFEEHNTGKVLQALDQINAVSKSLRLASSLFHHAALTESALYSGISPTSYRKGIKLLESKVFRDDAIDAGLQIGTPSDAQRQLVDKALDKISGGKFNPLKALKFGKEFNDKILWDYYHRGLKAYAYEKKIGQVLSKNKNLSQAEIKKLKQTVAQHVNNAFGGQNWDAMLKSAKWQKWAHRILLAPDWTLSNIRIATSVAKGGVEGQLARAYWLRAGFYFLTISNALNKALSGKWLWENEEGHRLDINTGGRDKKGRIEYIRLSKQVREPFNWVSEPVKELGRKAAPGINIASEQLTGRSAAGYPAFKKDTYPFEKSPSEISMYDRVVAVGKHFVPFSFSGNNKLFTFPITHGDGLKKKRKQRKPRR